MSMSFSSGVGRGAWRARLEGPRASYAVLPYQLARHGIEGMMYPGG